VQRRRIRNRLSAQFHRERKRTYIAHLEGLVKQRDIKLQEAAAALDNLAAENARLHALLGSGAPQQQGGGLKKSESVANYSSAGSTTSASLSDDPADDVGSAFSTPPPTPPMAAATELASPRNGGRRFRGATLARSGAPLLSVLFMLGITLFGPQQGQQGQQGQQQQRVATAPSDAGARSMLSAPLQLLQLPKPPHSEETKATVPHGHGHGHGRVVLSTAQDTKTALYVSSPAAAAAAAATASSSSSTAATAAAAAQQPPVVIHPQLFANAGRLGLSQPLWKYDSHVCNLYPPVARFRAPFYDTDGIPYNEAAATVGGNATAADTQRRTRRYLRTRTVNATAPTVPVRSDNVQDGGDVENSKSLVPAHALPALPARALPALPGSAAAGTGAPRAEPVAPGAGAASLSMSRVLLTTGRALLDPAIVVGATRPAPPAGAVHVQPQATAGADGETGADAHVAATALSTWAANGAGAAAAAVATADVPMPAAAPAPPVVSVGLGSLGASIGVAAAAGGVPGSPAGSSNMLVMLLPASAVRWGKVWSESSDGTMEAMLNGMNSHNHTGGWANAMGGKHNASANAEGMWVEIGCSIFRAQLVSNVTLAA
jgi:hypothetical protein